MVIGVHTGVSKPALKEVSTPYSSLARSFLSLIKTTRISLLLTSKHYGMQLFERVLNREWVCVQTHTTTANAVTAFDMVN